jgi:hypothetical protein
VGAQPVRSLEIGFHLDQLWHALRGEMETTKRPALVALGLVFRDAKTPYAIIGGVALQVHQSDPRTTLDIDVAVGSFDAIPRVELEAAGFQCRARFAHSENWIGPSGVPVQFRDDPALAPATKRAVGIDLDGVPLCVLQRGDLLHEKIRVGSDPARRGSKRLQDYADAKAILEETPELHADLSEAERAVLDSLPG